MMVIEQHRIDPWLQEETVLELPEDYEVLRVDLLPNGHYGLIVLYDGDAAAERRVVHVLTCAESARNKRIEFPAHHRYLGSIHPQGFDTCYYLFDIGVQTPQPVS